MNKILEAVLFALLSPFIVLFMGVILFLDLILNGEKI